ncbi:MAG: radical SAM protein [Candidatus Hydrogenedentes bacterium]|nr:radical SAM protein [Candidatus Hydrogenedentota bacterium]
MAGRYLHALKGVLDLRTPGYLIFFVTARCNCRCKMCFYGEAIDNAPQRNELSLDEIERFARRFPGLHQVNFSGGEPFLREDFAEIPVQFYRHSGTRFFTCPTNSSLPEEMERAIRAICTSCPDAWIRITQSLDGVGPVHDTLRGREGLFDCVVELNGRLARLTREFPNLSVGLTTVISKFNRDSVHETLDFVYDNLEFTDFGALFVRGTPRDPAARDVEAEDYVRFMAACIERRRTHRVERNFTSRVFSAIGHTVVGLVTDTLREDRFISPCKAGRRMVVMDDEGNVEPCELLADFVEKGVIDLDSSRLGNIREFDYDIRKLLGTEHARRVLRAIVEQKCYCTFECAWSVNVLYTPGLWPRVLKNYLRLGRGGS